MDIEIDNNLTKLSSDSLIHNLKLRGYTYDVCLQNKLNDIEKEYVEHRQNHYDISYIELYTKYDIPDRLIKTIQLLKLLDDYNINYIHYVLILDSFNIQQLKNVYRYLMIKWEKSKMNLSHYNHIHMFSFKDIIEEIRVENEDYNKLYVLFINKIEQFIHFNDTRNSINIYLIFFINTIQEYLYPIS